MSCTKCGTMMTTKFCLACKRELKPDDNFCTKCGTKRGAKESSDWQTKIFVLIICLSLPSAIQKSCRKDEIKNEVLNHYKQSHIEQTVPVEYEIYEAKESTTLSEIAKAYGVTIQDIRTANNRKGIGDGQVLPGQMLRIPKKQTNSRIPANWKK